MQDEKTHLGAPHEATPAGPEQAYSEDGVDLTLIRWMLSLTPTERLHMLQKSVQSLVRLRSGSSRHT